MSGVPQVDALCSRNIISITKEQLRAFQARRQRMRWSVNPRRKGQPQAPAKRKRGENLAKSHATPASPSRNTRRCRRSAPVPSDSELPGTAERTPGAHTATSPTAELDAPSCEVSACSLSANLERGTAAGYHGTMDATAASTPAASLWHHVGRFFVVNSGRARFRKALFLLGLSQLLRPPAVRQPPTRTSQAAFCGNSAAPHAEQRPGAPAPLGAGTCAEGSAQVASDHEPDQQSTPFHTIVTRASGALAQTDAVASSSCRRRLFRETRTVDATAHAAPQRDTCERVTEPQLPLRAADLAAVEAAHAETRRWLTLRVRRLESRLPGRVQLAAAAKLRAAQRELEETYKTYMATKATPATHLWPALEKVVPSR